MFLKFYGKHPTRSLCSDKCRSHIYSTNAKKNLGGNKNNKAYGWYVSPYAGKVWLESSWEYRVAKDLDENEISWIRPKSMKWFDPLNNKQRLYYPDFYLTDFDVYIDPKNNYLQVQDATKLEIVRQTHNIKLIVLSEHQLYWVAIKDLL